MDSRNKNAERNTQQKERKENRKSKLNSTNLESSFQGRGHTFHVSYFINQILQTCAA
jgi:hypothetical protein